MTNTFRKPIETLPTLLLVGSGLRPYREPILKMISKHANVWSLAEITPDWEYDYICGFLKVNTLNPVQMKASIPDDVKPDGVFCWDEMRLIPSAKLAKSLGLPGGNVDAINACRDKYLTRQSLSKLNVGQPVFSVNSTLEEAKESANRIGYPVIVKPRSMAASFGVRKVENDQELETAFEYAAGVTEKSENFVAEYYKAAKESDDSAAEHYFSKGVLIEQCVEGSEISIDSVVSNGRVMPLFVARKQTGFYPYCEEIGHVVNAKDPLLDDDEFIDFLNQTHKAVGFEDGCTHIEVMLTEDGPKIIEINARMGGDLIPYVGQIATNIDLGKIVVDVTRGQPVQLEEIDPSIAAIRFFYPDAECTVKSLEIHTDKLHPSVFTAAPLAGEGQQLPLPPKNNIVGRFGYAITKGIDAEECIQTAIDTQQLFELTTTS